MGSFLARAYAAQHGSELAGIVLTGTAGGAGALGKVGVLVASTQARLRGHTHTSGLMNTLTFGQYNSAFKPTRTDFDWLSRDPAEVDKYVNDPDCGFVFSAGGFADVLRGLAERQHRPSSPRACPRTCRCTSRRATRTRSAPTARACGRSPTSCGGLGVKDVTMTLWPEARHEILNETNRDEVEIEIVNWLDAHLVPAAA